MAMATQASLFTPILSAAKSADRVAAPWKQSLAQFSTPKPMKGASAVAHRPIRAMAEEAPPATKEPEAPAGFHPTGTRPQHPVPDLRRQHWRTSAESPSGGVLRDHVGVPQGTSVRDADRRGGHHEAGAEPAEIGKEGAVLGAGNKAEVEIQDQVPVLPGIPERGSAVFAPERRSVPGEGERGAYGSGAEHEIHR
ncbi:UNVERIFIED_CONTAM: Photosystem I reaction center subunit II, chloroplastic [Sesamum angustifolium]|uniref:Photosystem I reaction center subunit II, chloroplastic n=1 Tax=Sesamum angustifolium TaxID=2727405 RepID=A0AAW2P041_9LAMI